jgi:sugar/nucleoside kinase (ribokinase family)
MALSEDDVNPELVRQAASLVVTGTHFSTKGVAAASWKAIRIARDAGVRVVFDIDFRPSLWGLAAHASGETRYALSSQVENILKDILAVSDLVVGTEEELRVATNQDDLPLALHSLREISSATIVCKRGRKGCEIFPGRNDSVLNCWLSELRHRSREMPTISELFAMANMEPTHFLKQKSCRYGLRGPWNGQNQNHFPTCSGTMWDLA